MPAHDPQKNDKEFEMDVLFVEKKGLEKVPDGHMRIKFEWHGGTHSYFVEGLLEPETHLLDPKHNWVVFERNLPKSLGDAILRLLTWVQSFTQDA